MRSAAGPGKESEATGSSWISSLWGQAVAGTCLGAKDFGQIVQAMTKRQLLRPEQVDDIARAILNNRRP